MHESGSQRLFNRILLLSLFVILSSFGSVECHGALAERKILPNGMVLLHAEKKALPMIKVVVAIKAGSVIEPAQKAGLANLTADLLNEGTLGRSSRKISDEIDFVGGSLSTSGGIDYITVTLSVLKKDIDLGFDLLADIILNPAFSEEEIRRRKAVIRSSIIQQREDPGTVASKAFLRAVYGDHPYGWPPEGTEESIEAMSRQDITDFHRIFYAPNNSIMSVVGDISEHEVTDLTEKYLGNWKKRDIPQKLPQSPRFGENPLVIKLHKDISQAHVILGHLGISRDNPDYYAVSVMNYILGGGGFASRLMDNIRDNKGLSYDVHSSFSANKYAGTFLVGLQTKNTSANSAIDEILKEINRIISEPVSDKDLSDAKSYLTGSFPLRIDSNSKIASFLAAVEYYGLGLDYVERYKELIGAVTTDDVQRVARKYLNTKDYILVVIGNMDKASLKY